MTNFEIILPGEKFRKTFKNSYMRSVFKKLRNSSSKTSGLRFWLLRAVLRATAPSITDAGSIQDAAHNMIAHSRKILDATATNHHDRVLLQIVTDARDIRRHLHTIGQTDARDLAKRGVWLFGSCRRNLETHPSLVGAGRIGRMILERIGDKSECGRL